MNHSSTVDQTDTDKVVSFHGDHRVVVATADHIEAIYPFMRRIDQIEVTCMGSTPKESLEYGLAHDDVTLTALDADGVPFAMFGVGQVENLAYGWLLGTDGLLDNSYQFIKASRKYVASFTKPYGCIFNFVHQDNDLALRWLRFCGAKFIRRIEFSNQPFYEFVITSKNI